MTKQTRIVWMSRHSPLPSQLTALGRRFPGHILIVDPNPFDGVEDIVKRFKAMQADEMVVVAPLTLIRKLPKHGVYPITAEMEQVRKEEAEVTLGSARKPRHYRFSHFERFEGLRVKSHPLDDEIVGWRPVALPIHNPTMLLKPDGTKAVIKEKP